MVDYVTLIYVLYNVVITSVLSVAIGAAFYLYRRGNTWVNLVVLVLFGFCLLDNTIILLTEDSGFFAAMNNEIMTNVYTYKTLILLATDICYLAIHQLVMGGRLIRRHYIWVLVHTFFIGFIPLFIGGGALFIWLYYLPSQIFLFGVAGVGLRQLRAIPQEEMADVAFAHRYAMILKMAMVFAVLTVVEDSYVIFNVDFYSDYGTSIFNRNITEEVMTLCLAGAYLKLFWEITGRGLDSPHPSPILPVSVSVLEESDGRFERFCQHHGFTDRERELLRHTLANESNQQISEALFISQGTVKTHLHNIYSKVGVSKRSVLLQRYEEFE